MTTVCNHCGCGAEQHLWNCSSLEKNMNESPQNNTISSFRGEFRWLSNFWLCSVTFEGMEFCSVEHAYVAAKTLDPELREQVRKCSKPGDAKRLGTTIALRPDWSQVKVQVMEGLLRQKFARGKPLRGLLNATKPKILVEGNYWHDNFWGSCVCKKCENKGENILGKLLMNIRDNDT